MTGIDFTLERGCLISGRVLGADDRPITGATVAVYGPAHPKSSAWVQTARTDAKGHYTLHVPAGEQYLYLMSQPPLGYAPLKEAGRELTILRGLSRTEDFILPTAEILPPVTGTVCDASGAPVAGAILRVEGKELEDSFAFQGLTTDAAGRFTVPLRTRKPFTLTAESHGRYSEPTPLTAGQVLTLSLTKTPGVLTGTVVAPDGAPLKGIPVHLSRNLGGLGYSQQERESTTDATGHYRFSGLRPGERYWVGVGKEGKYGMSANHQSETVKIPSGSTVSLKPITLPRQ
jgi:Carboxypeptidase regulatory-like domain